MLEERLAMMVSPHPSDKVNFGQHADRTYQELLENCPKYAQWVRQTAAEESESNWRLRRLAEWLNQEKQPTRSTKRQGYPGDKPRTIPMHLTKSQLKGMTTSSETSGSSFQMIQSEAADSEKAKLIE